MPVTDYTCDEARAFCYKRLGQSAWIEAVSDHPMTPEEALRQISPDLTLIHNRANESVLLDASPEIVQEIGPDQSVVGYYLKISPWWKFWSSTYAIHMRIWVKEWSWRYK